MLRGHRGFGWWLAAATALGLAVRVVWLVVRWNHPIGFEDAYFYHQQANLLADGHGFVSPVPWFFVGKVVPAAEHPPLYSLYLSLFSFAGARSVGAHQLATTLLGVATIPLVGLAGREVRGPKVGVVAAIVAAVYPNLWYQDAVVWAEAMAQAVVALFVLVAYRYVRRPSARTLGTLALVAGLATMARVELILLFPVVVLPLALLTEPLAWRRRLRWAAAALAVLVLALLPWSVLNVGRFEELTTLSSNGGLTLASANCDTTYYGPRIGYWDFYCAEAAGSSQTVAGGDPSQLDAAARQDAVQYVRAHLGRVPAVLAARVGRITGLWRPIQQADLDQLEGRPRPVAFGGLATWWLVLGLGVAGAIRLRRLGVPSFPLLGPPVVVLLSMAAAFASTRYRASCEPAMVVLAAVGVEAAVVALWRRRDPAPGVEGSS